MQHTQTDMSSMSVRDSGIDVDEIHDDVLKIGGKSAGVRNLASRFDSLAIAQKPEPQKRHLETEKPLKKILNPPVAITQQQEQTKPHRLAKYDQWMKDETVGDKTVHQMKVNFVRESERER
jgi:hypothetical protein